jgi:membrane protein required for colicin V production
MNWVDITIVVVVALTTFSSLRAGVIRQAMALIGLAVGIYGAVGNYQRLAAQLATFVANPALCSAVAFIMILVVVWIGAAFVATLVRGALNAFGLGWADNLMGMIVGLLMGLLVVVGLLSLMVRLPIPALAEAVQNSSLAGYVFMLLPYFKKLLPSDLKILSSI